MSLHRLLVTLLALTPSLLLADQGARDRFVGLMNNSPFGRPAISQPKDAAVGDPLEFRAVLEERGSRFFSIYETTARRSVWVDLHESVNGFSVRAYDEEHACVIVEYQGKTLTLPLKGAASVARNKALATPSEIARPAIKTQTSDQPFRIGHVADEIAIRQAVRQDAAAPSTPRVQPKP
jgi:hypothetical protein